MFHLFVPAEPGKSIHPNFDLSEYELTAEAKQTDLKWQTLAISDYDFADSIVRIIMVWLKTYPRKTLKLEKSRDRKICLLSNSKRS